MLLLLLLLMLLMLFFCRSLILLLLLLHSKTSSLFSTLNLTLCSSMLNHVSSYIQLNSIPAFSNTASRISHSPGKSELVDSQLSEWSYTSELRPDISAVIKPDFHQKRLRREWNKRKRKYTRPETERKHPPPHSGTAYPRTIPMIEWEKETCRISKPVVGNRRNIKLERGMPRW